MMVSAMQSNSSSLIRRKATTVHKGLAGIGASQVLEGSKNSGGNRMCGRVAVPRVLTRARSRIRSCVGECSVCTHHSVQIRHLPRISTVHLLLMFKRKYLTLCTLIHQPRNETEMNMQAWTVNSRTLYMKTTLLGFPSARSAFRSVF